MAAKIAAPKLQGTGVDPQLPDSNHRERDGDEPDRDRQQSLRVDDDGADDESDANRDPATPTARFAEPEASGLAAVPFEPLLQDGGTRTGIA